MKEIIRNFLEHNLGYTEEVLVEDLFELVDTFYVDKLEKEYAQGYEEGYKIGEQFGYEDGCDDTTSRYEEDKDNS